MALNCWFAATAGKGALSPFRTVATIVQGSPPESAPVWLGMVVHSVLAAVLGLLFAALLVPLRRRSAGWLQWAGLLFGAAVYIVGFQVLARAVPRLSALLDGTNQPLSTPRPASSTSMRALPSRRSTAVDQPCVDRRLVRRALLALAEHLGARQVPGDGGEHPG
jgi:hypothetical protein